MNLAVSLGVFSDYMSYMSIPEEKISEILAAADIVDVISDSVSLKKAGQSYVGLCPFHSEKTPSFHVSPQKQIFHCFGCSAGGNAVSFLMKYNSISFPEAASNLAKRYGITIETPEISPFERKKLQMKEGLYRINNCVKDYYAAQLKSGISSADARLYLKNRSISQETINDFCIGYAPDKWDSIVLLLKKMKLSKKTAEESGLVLKKKSGSGYYDRFRNRIIFPIFDINMQIAGFGGRVMDSSMPKYLNSPETAVYSKGKILYGLHISKNYCRRQGCVYIVEGYLDFLSLYQRGIKNCAATLGTALTSEHLRLLKGYAAKTFLVFDSDDAGVNAAKRSVELFYKEGMELRVIILPSGDDPDSFIKQFGKEAFESAAKNSMSAIEFLIEQSVKKHGLSIEGRLAVLEEAVPYLASINDSTARTLYIREAACRLGIDEEAVIEKVRACISLSNAENGIFIKNYNSGNHSNLKENDNNQYNNRPKAFKRLYDRYSDSDYSNNNINNLIKLPIINNNNGPPRNFYKNNSERFTSINSSNGAGFIELYNLYNKSNISNGQNNILSQNFKESESGLKKSRDINIEFEAREEQLLSIMLQFPQVIQEVKNNKVIDYFYSDKLKNIGRLILSIASSVYSSNSIDNSNSDENSSNDNIEIISTVMSSAANEADRELIASLAMMEWADSDNDDVLEKSLFLIKRIIRVRNSYDDKLSREIRKIEKIEKAAQYKKTNDSDNDITLELLKKRQEEIRKLRGFI